MFENISLARDLSFRNGSVFYDRLYLRPMFEIEDSKEIEWKNESMLSFSDSVEVQFFLPVHSIFSGKRFDVISNPIRVSYLNLLEMSKDNYYEEKLINDSIILGIR